MISREQFESAQQQAREYLSRVGIIITPEEATSIEVADFGPNELFSTGLELVIYVDTHRVCAKELVLCPRQTCPEHYHPPMAGEPGKEETFRCRWGEAYLYVPGEATPNPKARPPKGRENPYNVWHEIVLRPGKQYTLMPNTPHRFQAGDEGAVVSEFSTRSRDESHIFTDPQLRRGASGRLNLRRSATERAELN